jgi:hypothetical protein
MKLAPSTALALLVVGCTYEVRPDQPPSDARERRRAEIVACSQGTLPAWLDDNALGAAIRMDRREAQASTANESFHGATFSSQPPAATTGSSRASAMLEDRRIFQQWCAGTHPGPSGFVKP